MPRSAGFALVAAHPAVMLFPLCKGLAAPGPLAHAGGQGPGRKARSKRPRSPLTGQCAVRLSARSIGKLDENVFDLGI